MTAIEQWNLAVQAYRLQSQLNEPKYWGKIAGWYDRFAQANDHLSQVFPVLTEEISRDSAVLEIGPGSGLFTLPLAREVRRLTAVEPADGMRSLLTKKLSSQQITNVDLIPAQLKNHWKK